MNTLQFAEFYAKHNWQIFPCQPGHKEPAVKWADVATTDEKQIHEWWEVHPDYNIGLATGKRSGVVVVDIDAGHGGEESLSQILRERGSLPATVTAKTGGGGRHLLFAHPGIEIRNSASKLGRGLDIRGDGGYIVAPPSLHPSGNHYEWVREYAPSKTKLADMPAWMVDTLTAVTPLEYPQTPAAPEFAPSAGAIQTGSRNQILTSLAGTMRRRGMSEEAVYTALLAENRAKCMPPLTENEVGLIAKSVCRYQPTAAPVLQNRDRLEMEWSFARAIFDIPNYEDFLWLSPDLFSDENLRQYWQSVLSGETVTKSAASAGILPELEKYKSEPNHIDIYAAQISKYGYLAGIAKTGLEIHRLASQGDESRLHQVLETLAENKNTSIVLPKTTYDGLMDLQNSLDEGRQFIKTGLGNFDQITGGLERKTLSILAARPSMGKTTLAWQVARNVAASGARVLFLSLEVSGTSLWRKAAYGLAEIAAADVENGKVCAEKMDTLRLQIIPELLNVYNDRIFIYDEPPYTTSQLGKIAVNTRPDLIIVDHIGYVDEPADNIVQRLGKVTKWAKRIAKKINCHAMVLCQLNRGVEARENKVPILSDLRDSGNIEEDADMVIMPYRPAYYADQPIPMRYSETQLFIRKNRDGRLGSIGIYLDMLHQWFYRRDELPPNFGAIKLD